ncbi:hypothetical protein FY528_12360 [Hymenobacter lutimineralis]|uniref:Uncharacterized protein n=1 Tax=Hymenobacter lutimineralis TaxID=2606448 RepID=A0A5D6V268_9BACT|nr:hypothetical protein [Hymenobacter lutimineralis]TYZ08664.1 hypothetical protein FY528_12360 [Hymenobacter lutimineralis]
MSAPAFEKLLREAFPLPAEAARYLTPAEHQAYAALEKAPKPELAFRFERVRLVVAMALIKLLADLGDHEESRRVLAVLHRAAQAGSIGEIDKAIHRDAQAFEQLYTNLYVNDEGEQVLQLFERTLDADSREAMDDVLFDALVLLPQLDFSHYDEEEDEA